MGALWNTWGGVHSPATLIVERGLCERNLEGVLPYGDPEGYGEGSGDGHLSICALLGNLEAGSFTTDFERWMR
jgi:hypothetical protein